MSPRVKKLREVLADLAAGDPIRILHEVQDDVELTVGVYVEEKMVEAPWSSPGRTIDYRVVVVDADAYGVTVRKTIPFVTIDDLTRREA